MGRIYIRDLALRCVIGAFPQERKDKQDVVINVVLEGTFDAAVASDRLDDAVDYKTITKLIIALVEGSDFHLLESLADRIAAVCLEDEQVTWAKVTVDKPGALRFARSVAVEVEVGRPSNIEH